RRAGGAGAQRRARRLRGRAAVPHRDRRGADRNRQRLRAPAHLGSARQAGETNTEAKALAVDTSNLTQLDVEPGTLPETMAAWVIRQEREGEPKDAFQLEQIEVPEPGAFEVIVRVMAAGVNFNNVWASLGKPVSVFGYGDHPEYGHHIGGSDASGVVWKVGEGVP